VNFAEARLGMYGKIPILGDFVSRGLPADFIHAWDAWLQDSISASRQDLGAEWLDIFLTSPIWRFFLSSGVCGENAWAGVLIPSVDRVGRYFPLTLAISMPGKNSFPLMLIQAGEWFEVVENMALSALQDDFDMTRFDEERHHIHFPDIGPYMGRQNNLEKSLHVDMAAQEDMAQVLADLSSGLMDKFMPEYSVWITTGSKDVRSCLRVYGSLPPASAFSTFLTDGPGTKGENSIGQN